MYWLGQIMEKTVEAYLRQKVRDLGGMSIKLKNPIGIPDRLILMPGGKTMFVELKDKGKKPRGIQLVRHRELRTLGFDVFVIDSKDEVREVFDEKFNAT